MPDGAMAEASTADYGILDRLLHRVAFAHPRLQRALADLENDLFKRQMKTVAVERPVFVTGLPRAGTTLLLEWLYGTGEFATFTYRQMPFVLSPLLWHRLSAGSRRTEDLRARAHGDDMMIGHDSPEAFEEVLWINYLSSTLFNDGGMNTLDGSDLNAEFRDAYRRLARKIVCLATIERAQHPTPRYLSKNNANIGRFPAIFSVFADAMLLCCVRDPIAQAASLHRQHARFNALHDGDVFAERYMAWVGHHDFGRNFRPVRFTRKVETASPDELSFWLQYWIDGYRHALANATSQVHFVCFDSLLREGADGLARVASCVGLQAPSRLTDAADQLRAPTTADVDIDRLPDSMVIEARALYQDLTTRAV